MARETARQKAAAFRAAERKRQQRRRVARWAAVVVGVLVVAAAVTIGVVLSSGSGSPGGSTGSASATLAGPAGPEGIVLEQGRLLAPASTSATGQTVDGIRCDATEQVVYHIHTHLAVYVDGALRPIPAGIGIVSPVPQQTANGAFDSASRCYYWLHVHAQDGIIHVESPNRATYTLGQFFDIWRQPLSATQVGPARGRLTAFVDGVRYHGNPAAIPLKSHEDVQLDLGEAVPPKKIDWSHAQL